jgi:hypothetical protein
MVWSPVGPPIRHRSPTISVGRECSRWRHPNVVEFMQRNIAAHTLASIANGAAVLVRPWGRYSDRQSNDKELPILPWEEEPPVT